MIVIRLGTTSVIFKGDILISFYPWIVAIFSPLIYMPIVYFLFKDLNETKEIMIRVYILFVVSNIFDLLVYGSEVTPF